MNNTNIQFHTIKFLNGISYLYDSQIDAVKSSICSRLKISETKENHDEIQKGIEMYFKLINEK